MDTNFKAMDLLDVLLDANNRDPVTMMDENGRQMNFEQVAVIPMAVGEERRLYCLLKPLEQVEGIAGDEAIVFPLNIGNGPTTICVEEDAEVVHAVYAKYEKLCAEAQSKKFN